MENRLNINPSPHFRSKINTNLIMYIVCIALLPSAIYGVFNFGSKAILVLLLSICSCLLTEVIYDIIVSPTHSIKDTTVLDGSALVTGILLGMNLPVSVSWYLPVLGGVFAIFVVKKLYGGLGQNFMNPALGARCFLVLSFTKQMTNFECDAYSGATPLAKLKAGDVVSIKNMFFGNTAGTIGETSALLLLIGAVILLLLGIIKLTIPLTYIMTFVVFIIIFSGNGLDINYIVAEVLGGGLILGAFFMATDYVTSPITFVGQIVFGVILGILTGLFRVFGATAEGVSYAIIITNLLVPLIEKFTIPKSFGAGE